MNRLKSSVAHLKPLAPWAGGFAGGLLLASLLWFLLAQLPQRNVPSIVDEETKRRADLVNANRDNILKVIQTLAGLGFFATAYLAWQNYQLTEDKNVTDRFSKAVEMLANEKLEIRLGGIYLLERIAKDSKEDHPIAMEILVAFIRNKIQSEDYGEPEYPTEDIQSVLTVLGRRKAEYDQQPLFLKKLHLKRAHLYKANLVNADLQEANLQHSYLERANLSGAELEGAEFTLAIMSNADLTGASLVCTGFVGARLDNANFHKAQLHESDFRGAFLKNAKFGRSYLTLTELKHAESLTQEQITCALLCGTKLPSHIDLDPDRDCGQIEKESLSNVWFEKSEKYVRPFW